MTDSSPTGLYTISCRASAGLDDDQASALALRLADRAVSWSVLRHDNHHRGEWVVTWVVDFVPDLSALETETSLTGLRAEPVPDIDWRAHSYRTFAPFSIGSFFVYGSHHEGLVPVGMMPLQIDAATAFGSGEHGTTAGCILALEQLKARGVMPGGVLDMGTGSGILAVAAARLWPGAHVLAVDNDEESVIVARRHADLNRVGDFVSCVCGDGFAAPAVTGGMPFPLIVANILAGPLILMAPDLVKVLVPGGFVVLSGILDEQADEVLAAYEALGLKLTDSASRGGWTTLIFSAPGN